MRQSQFTETQIVSILKEADAGRAPRRTTSGQPRMVGWRPPT